MPAATPRSPRLASALRLRRSLASRSAALLLVTAAFTTSGCASSSDAATATPVPEPLDLVAISPALQDEQSTVPGRLSQAQVQAEATRILQEVAAARELEVIKTIAVKTIDHEGIRKHAKDSMYDDITPEQMALLGRIEQSLGVLPPGSDPETVMLDLLEQGVLGLYDPKQQTLFVGSFVEPFMLAMVVGHEIAHGLQDMHFDLQRHTKPIWHESDQESARRFLIEGEAQAAYISWAGQGAGLTDLEDSTLVALGEQALSIGSEMSPYPILVRSLQMPYAHGTATIARLVNARGWGAVDELYQHLPTTTEQMLHIDKLLAREPAKAVELDREKLERELGMTAIWYDTLGEASFLAMLAQVETARVATAAAAGWGGDQYVALTPAGSETSIPTVVSAVAWDTVEDAAQFEKSYGSYLHEVVGEEQSLIERRGETVVFATQVGAGERAKVKAAAWAALSSSGKARSAR